MQTNGKKTAPRKLILSLSLSLLLALIVAVVMSQASPEALPRTVSSGHHFLPPYPNPRDRFGFDSSRDDPLTNYDIALLNAGWYSDWGSSANPAHPDRLTYVQLIRFSAGTDRHDPAQVTVSPNRTVIAQISTANPGTVWLMSNEPDSQYQGNPILPEVYAHVYHEFYTYIKGLDPTALIANGGIVQPTPCRIEYLDIVWDTYYRAYSETLPVDVWNIHAFTLREVYNSWGASTPPGVDPSCAIDYAIRDADDVDIFRDNLIAFRGWMKDKGEQDKPLIISEYGILWPSWLNDEDGLGWSAARVSHFMTQTFDILLYETYPEVGYPADDYRLVQAWAWYSVSDTYYNGRLFNPSTGGISLMGQTYADYTANLPDPQYTDLAVWLQVDSQILFHLAPTLPHEALTVTLPVDGSVANLGKLGAYALVSAPLLGYQDTLSIPARYEGEVGTLPLPSLVLTQPGVYDLSLIADPAQGPPDARSWNNGFTVTVDARPDLVISTANWSAHATTASSGTLSFTLTVANTGTWPSPAVSGTLEISDTQLIPLLSDHRFPIPAIGSGSYEIMVETLPLLATNGGLYQLAFEVDSDDIAPERIENNNRTTTQMDIRPDLVISTATWSVHTTTTSTGTLSITLTVANTGTWPSHPVSGTLEISDTQTVPLISSHRFPIPAINDGEQSIIVEELTLPASSGDLYQLALKVDSDNTVGERSESNNRASMEMDIRPDYAISTTAWSVRPPGLSSGALTVTLKVTNQGPWPALPVSTTLSLKDLHGTLLLPDRHLHVPALVPGTQITTVETLVLPAPTTDIYHLIATVDGDGIQAEPNEGNNSTQVIARIVVTTTLQPEASGVLTSTSEHIGFAFPPGTVTTTTEIRFTPLLTSEVPPGPLVKVAAFRLEAYRNGRLVSIPLPLPVTVTWRYKDADVARLDESALTLRRLDEEAQWQLVSDYQSGRWPDENRLSTVIQQLGKYALGQSYRRLLPLFVWNGEER